MASQNQKWKDWDAVVADVLQSPAEPYFEVSSRPYLILIDEVSARRQSLQLVLTQAGFLVSTRRSTTELLVASRQAPVLLVLSWIQAACPMVPRLLRTVPRFVLPKSEEVEIARLSRFIIGKYATTLS